MKIVFKFLFSFLSILMLYSYSEAYEVHSASNLLGDRMVPTVICLKVDFDVYRIHVPNKIIKKEPYFIIMPAPEIGIGGAETTYLGRMPAGTMLKVEATQLQRGGYGRNRRGSYWVKPIHSLGGKIKGNRSRRSSLTHYDISNEVFMLASIGSGIGLYSDGSYPNGMPVLNEIWFEIIDLKE